MSHERKGESPLPICRHCGERIQATVNGIPMCTTKKCMDRLIALAKRGGKA